MTSAQPADEGGTWISSGQIYREVIRIGTELVELRKEVQQASNHDTRITALEHRVWTASGAAAAVGTGAGYLLQFLTR